MANDRYPFVRYSDIPKEIAVASSKNSIVIF